MATLVVAWDDGRIGDEMTLAGIAKRLDEISSQLSSETGSLHADIKSLDGKFQSLDGKFQSLDGKLTALDHKMTIEFEETRRVINLGFENVEMLDEKMDRRFEDAEHANAGHRSVLEAAIVGLSRDMKSGQT